jgi:nitrogen regulation protein NR(I)
MSGKHQTICIIDDDDQLRTSFHKLLTEEGYKISGAASGEAGIELIRRQTPDLVILDMRLPGINGLETFKVIHEFEPKLPVIIMTAYGSTETAIEATKLGAFDYVLKPFDIPNMLKVIHQALAASHFMRFPVDINGRPDQTSGEAIIGRSLSMQAIYKAIGRAAPTDATVLIRGESGTGKELVARAIYQHSLRAQEPFLVINCVAIPETLLESELFGYEKGAFTGATHRRVGKIEQANGGTVFLDEIGDMPMSLQAKILRLLQEKSVERLGGRETIPVDVRIITATNRDLEKAVVAGRFREDLYYRIKVVTIQLPSLWERVDDIPLLIEYFLARQSADLGVENPGIKTDALATLKTYPFPGNVRELENIIKKVLIFNRGMPISKEDIVQTLGDRAPINQTDQTDGDESLQQWARRILSRNPIENLFDTCMDRFAEILVKEALNITEGNRSQAAKLLGLSRPTLHSKIEKYQLEVKTTIEKTSL